ncbi:MAG: methyltransferase domain-containing protein [Candidatus Undinarchaeales archaeon]|nr:methyltransferase domain-containing protein [Candidatus Undinarchaeales archaeon]
MTGDYSDSLIYTQLLKFPKETTILDAGCGEGVVTEELAGKGYDVIGLDMNFSSPLVIPGDITRMPFKDDSFELVLLLDVIEHVDFTSQISALVEVKRVLHPGGHLILSVPNLAHLTSRIKFLISGSLVRTADIKKHPGDRPVNEMSSLIESCGFRITSRTGISPTFPLFYQIVERYPSRSLLLYNLNSVNVPPTLST